MPRKWLSDSASGPRPQKSLQSHTSLRSPEASGIDSDFNIEQGIAQLQKFKKTHQWDYNLDYEQIDSVNKVLRDG